MPVTEDTISWPRVFRLSWPLVATMFLQFSVGLADVYVAGLFQPAVQGAVGFASQILFFFTSIANGLGVGIVAVVARSAGRTGKDTDWHPIRQGLLIALLIALPLSILGILSGKTFYLSALLPEPVAGMARLLLPFYAFSLIPQAILAATAAIYRARMEMPTILLCAGLASVLNLAGDFILPFGYFGLPAIGPLGIAVATAVSSLIGALLAISLLVRRGMRFFSLRPDRNLARRFWRFGWPAGALQLGWQLGSRALYTILGHLPANAVAATAALTNGLRIEAVLYLPVFALNMVTAVLVGRALGEGNDLLATRTGWRIAGGAALLLGILAVPVFIFSKELAAVLSPDMTVRMLTGSYLRINMLSQPFMAASVCLGGALEGAGDAKSTMKAVLAALWLFRLPLAFLLGIVFAYGATGVWSSMVLSMVLQYLLLAAIFKRGRWAASDGGRQ